MTANVFLIFTNLFFKQVSLVAPVQQHPMQELVRPVSEEPEPESQMEARFDQTTLEQADTTQGEGAEPDVAMDTGVAMETNIGTADVAIAPETKEGEGEEVEEGDGDDGDSGVQETEEGEDHMIVT